MTDKREPRLSRRRYLQAAGVGMFSTVGAGAAAAAGGEERWRFEADDAVLASPTVVEDTVYVGSRDENVYALDAASGDKQWQFAAGSVDAAPTVVEDTVFVGSTDDNVYALDAASGEPRWTFQTDWKVTTSPIVADGTVFVGSWDENVYAIDAATGEQQWRFETGSAVTSSPAVVEDTVFVGSNDGNVYAVDAVSGEQQWGYETGLPVVSSPTVADDTVFVGSNDGNVYALDAVSGDRQWAVKTGGQVRSSPTVAAGTAFVGSADSNVYALDAASGNREWRFDTGVEVESSPTVVGETVFVPSREGTVYAVDAASGESQWHFDTDHWVFSSPVVVDGTVFLGGYDGTVYALAAEITGSSEGSRAKIGTLGHHDGMESMGQISYAESNIEISCGGGCSRYGFADAPVGFRCRITNDEIDHGDLDSYDWSLDGTTYSGRNIEHTFTEVGEYTIELVATYWTGQELTATETYEIRNRDLSTSFTFSPDPATSGEPVTFNGSASGDWRGSIASYDWSIGGATYSGETVEHTFSEAGDINVELTATDTNGATDSATQTISVQSQPPSPSFTYSPDSPVSGEQVTFDASGSSDPDGSITSYDWSIESITYSGKTVDHTFPDDGDFTVELTVTDNEGESASTTEQVTVQNTGPRAIIYIPRNGAPTGESVTVYGDSSTDDDGTITSYDWSVDGTAYSGDIIEHTFADEGEYTILLTVTDDDGATDTTTTRFSVSNRSPSPSFTFSPGPPVTGEPVTFDGSASADPDGTILEYGWSIDGTTYSGATAEHTFSDDGEYAVELSVSDDDGESATTTEQITVQNQAPLASFTFSPDRPAKGEPVTFDASESSDPDGSIQSYDWWVNEMHHYGETCEHTFTEYGTHDVELIVTDDDGETHARIRRIDVENQPPAASFTFSPDSPMTGETVTFHASESSDQDGSIESYEWSIDGTPYSEQTVEHTFIDSGEYNVELTVTDDGGETDSTTQTVAIENQTPTASYTFSPQSPANGEPVTFDASESSDPEGPIESYEWTIDGTTYTGETVEHTFSTEGEYSPNLTVTDGDGKTDTTTQTVSVENQSPSAAFSHSPDEPVTGETVTFDASASSDPDGAIESYEWVIGGTSHTGETVEHTFSDSGGYSAELTVADDDGGTDTTSAQVSVEASVSKPTETETPTDTPPETETPTDTPPETETPTDTPSETETPVETPSETETPQDMPSETETPVDTPSETETPTETPPETKTPVDTPSESETPTDMPPETDTTNDSNSEDAGFPWLPLGAGTGALASVTGLAAWGLRSDSDDPGPSPAADDGPPQDAEGDSDSAPEADNTESPSAAEDGGELSSATDAGSDVTAVAEDGESTLEMGDGKSPSSAGGDDGSVRIGGAVGGIALASEARSSTPDEASPTPDDGLSVSGDAQSIPPVTDRLDEMDEALDTARSARETGDYERALSGCQRAIDTATGAQEAADGDAPGQLRDIEDRREAAKALSRAIRIERDAHDQVMDHLREAADALEEAEWFLETDPDRVLQLTATAAQRVDNAVPQVEQYAFEDAEDRRRQLCERIEELREQAELAQRRATIPETIPTAPRLSLTPEEINVQWFLESGPHADLYSASTRAEEGSVDLALKELRLSDTADSDIVDRLLAGGETWSQLSDHDHIVDLVDFGTDPDPWFAMEYMDGRHLGERGPEMSLKQALWTAMRVAEGVSHAHESGEVHLDLKPSNVLFRQVEVDWDPPKVADWGVSKHLLEHSNNLEDTAPPYAPPERFDDRFGDLDHQSDIYQLGAICYELFTGEPVFSGETVPVVLKVKSEQPRPPSEVADVPERLDEILLRALAKEKADRYASVEAFRADLREVYESL